MYGHTRSYRTHLAALAGLCFALFSVSSVAITIDLGPSDYRSWGTGTNAHTSQGLRSSTGQTIRMPPLNTNLNVTRNAVIPYGSIANGMRNFVRINPASVAASAAVTGLFLAVDWVFDQESGEWSKFDVEVAPIEDGTYAWHAVNDPSSLYPSPLEACVAYYPGTEFVTRSSSSSFRCQSSLGTYGFAARVGDSCPVDYSYNSESGRCERGVLIDLDASDWSTLADSLPSSSPDTVGQAGHDVQRRIGDPLPGYFDQTMTGPSSISGDTTTTTTTDPVTGQSTITETSTTTNISYGDTTITTTTTTTSTSYNSDGSVSSETVTETSPGQEVVSGTTSDWPGFCEWASVVCEWFDWTQDGWDHEEPDLPQIIDFDSSGDYEVGGPGDCPAPYTINLGWMLNTSLEVSYQPFCDFAGLVKPLFLAFCYLFAGVMTVRSL